MDLWALRRLVSQRSLKSCRLEFEDRPLEDASLFPLFDEEGRTRMVMITAEENARIMLADWAPGLFVRDWPWRNRLRLRFTDLDDALVWDEERLDDLWHFDPWWVLGEERYQGHGSVPGLRRTNIPGYDSTVSDLVFSADLERASYVVKKGSGHSVKVRRFTADTLVAMAGRRQATPERPRATVAATWRLRPLWRFR
ncbi:MAG TPA: hypothetical protein VFB85_16520 [Vicinamibacterales bacterium]|jgi:hypothetical protein|nr:hypothetical protein [Vicinamibacterales bacterium]